MIGTRKYTGALGTRPYSWIRPTDERGKSSIVPAWVTQFGDRVFHHLAIRVHDIEQSIAKLRARGIVFVGESSGLARVISGESLPRKKW